MWKLYFLLTFSFIIKKEIFANLADRNLEGDDAEYWNKIPQSLEDRTFSSNSLPAMRHHFGRAKWDLALLYGGQKLNIVHRRVEVRIAAILPFELNFPFRIFFCH
jgi:hypothetical protein